MGEVWNSCQAESKLHKTRCVQDLVQPHMTSLIFKMRRGGNEQPCLLLLGYITGMAMIIMMIAFKSKQM